jgi:anti-sigma B factor antagonist
MTKTPTWGGSTPFLSAQAHRSDGTVVVSIQGEIDLASAPELERELLSLFALSIHQVVLDFAGMTFMDSTGLAVLLLSARPQLITTSHS